METGMKLKIILLFLLALTKSAISDIIYIPQDYPTIQAGLYAASPGDTLLVAPGTYAGFLWSGNTLPNIHVLGSGGFGSNASKLMGNVSSDGIYLDDVTGWEIAGFEITNYYSGINIECSYDITVHNNYIHNNPASYSYGIHLEYCDGILLHHNVLSYNNYVALRIHSGNENISVINNTILYTNSYHGILIMDYVPGLEITNNIIAFNNGNGVQFAPGSSQGDAIITYNDNYGNGGNWNNCTPGIGNISLNPLFTNNPQCPYTLQLNSPCVNAGDPSILDPDGTRSDIGAIYYDFYQFTGILNISLTPINPPIIIPASGGSFSFTVNITCQNGARIFDGWYNVMLPDSSLISPMLLRQNLYLSSGGNINRNLTVNVPAGAPSGIYHLIAYVGFYPDSVADSDSFTFEKLATGEGNSIANLDWNISGWDTVELSRIKDQNKSNNNILLSAKNNPFNTKTILTLDLLTTGEISLRIFDINGREVQRLAEGYYAPGSYQFTFEGGPLASGIYFALLRGKKTQQIAKLLYVK